jgi:hypothetical protein
MNDLIIVENKIYEIRGQKVMLDFDLAEMYEIETKYLKQMVRRNIERFPADFMFQLSNEEVNYLEISLRLQIATSNKGGNRYAPFATSGQSGKNHLCRLLLPNKVSPCSPEYFEALKPSKSTSTSCEPLSTCASTCSPMLQNRNWKN